MSNRRMWLRRSCAIALAPLLTLVVTAPANAARAGGEEGDDPAADAKAKPCPTDQWTVPLEVQGLACILLLPKKDGAAGGGGGGLGGLLG
jgi:hypothetical protein